MTIDRKRFHEIQKQKIEDRTLSATLSLLHAKVPAEKLTNSAEWNNFLELIEGFLETEHKVYEAAQSKLASPMVVNQDQIMLIKMQLHASQAVIAALTKVSVLPKQIIESAQRLSEKQDVA